MKRSKTTGARLFDSSDIVCAIPVQHASEVDGVCARECSLVIDDDVASFLGASCPVTIGGDSSWICLEVVAQDSPRRAGSVGTLGSRSTVDLVRRESYYFYYRRCPGLTPLAA